MKFLNSLVLCCMTSFVYADTARMLVIYGVNNQFTIEELAQEIDAHTLCISDCTKKAIAIARELREEINRLDLESDNHRIIIDCSMIPIKNLEKKSERLAQLVGYDYIMIADQELGDATKTIAEKEQEIPLTDDTLPRVNALRAGQLYDLMMRVDAFFKKHNLLYWATCGTLLGAVRHKGLIPWDDDLDIAMMAQDTVKLLSLKEELHAVGLDICMHICGWYKIFPLDGMQIKIIPEYAKFFPDQEYFLWRFPCLDVFAMHLTADNKISHSCDGWRKDCPNEQFLPQEILAPMILMPFGPMHLPVPQNFIEIVERMYGKSWNDITYAEWDHQNEVKIKKVKVKLTDRSTIPYILPLH